MSLSVSGLASGMDTASIIEQLVAIKQVPVTNLTAQKTALTTKNSYLNTLKSSYTTLASAISDITTAKYSTDWANAGSIIAKSSDTSKVGVILNSQTAETATYNVKVNQLATATYAKSSVAANWDLNESLVSKGVSVGSIKINNVQFSIDNSTTLSSLMSKINTNADVGVTASFEAGGALKFTSNNTGEAYISFEDGTSDFFAVLDLVDSSNNLQTGNQQLGQNAIIKINDTVYENSSNNFNSDITGLEGLVIQANDVTSSAIKVSVAEGENTPLSLLKNLVSSYNSVISQTNTATKTGGTIGYDSQLSSIVRSLRNTTTSSLNSASIDRLYEIGVSTAASGAGLNDDTTSLSIDEAKFMKAFENNPDAVKNLISDFSSALKTTVNMATDSTSCYFTSKINANERMINNYTKRIDNMNNSIDSYKDSLTTQFNYMESVISALKTSYSKMSSVLS